MINHIAMYKPKLKSSATAGSAGQTKFNDVSGGNNAIVYDVVDESMHLK